MSDHKHKISRRKFLKKASVATAAASLGPAIISLTPKTVKAGPGPLTKWPGRYVLNYNSTHTCTYNGGTTGDLAIVKKMVDDSIKLLTGEGSVGAAWKAIFPATLSASSNIAIKIIPFSGALTHPYIIKGVTDGLLQMDLGGTSLPPGNIYIYDTGRGAPQCSDALFPGINKVKGVIADHGDGALGLPYNSILHDCDFLINIPGIRGMYVAGFGGVTIGFKNHYGTYKATHTNTVEHVSGINCTGPINKKTVLTVISALFGMNIGHGPTGSADNFITYAKTKDPDTNDGRSNTIVLSNDPITAEFQALKIMRINVNEPYTAASMPDYLKNAAGLIPGGYNIGVIDEAQMDSREIINGTQTTPVKNPPVKKPVGHQPLRVYPNPCRSYTFIDFTVPGDVSAQQAEIEIGTAAGKVIRKLSEPVKGARNQVSWDGKDSAGNKVPAGRYLFKVTVGKEVYLDTAALIK